MKTDFLNANILFSLNKRSPLVFCWVECPMNEMVVVVVLASYNTSTQCNNSCYRKLLQKFIWAMEKVHLNEF